MLQVIKVQRTPLPAVAAGLSFGHEEGSRVCRDGRGPLADREEREAWLAVTSVVIRLPSALNAQLQRDAGISHFEYQVMAGLSSRPSARCG